MSAVSGPAPRLRTDVWVAGYIRKLSVLGVNALVYAKGDETAGTVLIRVNKLDGTSRVFGAIYNMDGEREWQAATSPDPCADEEADAFVARARDRDPDLVGG